MYLFLFFSIYFINFNIFSRGIKSLDRTTFPTNIKKNYNKDDNIDFKKLKSAFLLNRKKAELGNNSNKKFENFSNNEPKRTSREEKISVFENIEEKLNAKSKDLLEDLKYMLDVKENFLIAIRILRLEFQKVYNSNSVFSDFPQIKFLYEYKNKLLIKDLNYDNTTLYELFFYLIQNYLKNEKDLNINLIINEIKKTNKFISNNYQDFEIKENEKEFSSKFYKFLGKLNKKEFFIEFSKSPSKLKINEINGLSLIKKLILEDYKSFLDLHFCYFLKHFLEKEKNSIFCKEVLKFIESISKKNIFYFSDPNEKINPNKIKNSIQEFIIKGGLAFERIKKLLEKIDKKKEFIDIYFIPIFQEKSKLRKFGETTFAVASAVTIGFLAHKFLSKNKADGSKTMAGLKFLTSSNNIVTTLLPQTKNLNGIVLKLFDKLTLGKVVKKDKFFHKFFVNFGPLINLSLTSKLLDLVRKFSNGKINLSISGQGNLYKLLKNTIPSAETKQEGIIKIFLSKDKNYKDIICFTNWEIIANDIQNNFYVKETNSKSSLIIENLMDFATYYNIYNGN